jgi:hypothetical protein
MDVITTCPRKYSAQLMINPNRTAAAVPGAYSKKPPSRKTTFVSLIKSQNLLWKLDIFTCLSLSICHFFTQFLYLDRNVASEKEGPAFNFA